MITLTRTVELDDKSITLDIYDIAYDPAKRKVSYDYTITLVRVYGKDGEERVIIANEPDCILSFTSEEMDQIEEFCKDTAELNHSRLAPPV